MKKLLVVVAFLATSLGASAHWSNSVHYHNADGTAVNSTTIRPVTVTTYETDSQGRRVRVETTTTCIATRINPDNNHLRCVDDRVTVKRTVEEARPTIAPVVYVWYDGNVRVTTTYTCSDARWYINDRGVRAAGCWNWVRSDRRENVVDRPTIAPVVYRHIERDSQGRRVIVTTTYTCVDARWSPDRTQALCFRWDEDVDREVVRRQPRDTSLDLNGDGRVEVWERLVYEAFREILDDN